MNIHPLAAALIGQLRQPPTTENVGTAQEPIWKVTANGQPTPEELIRWWAEQLDATETEQFNQGDPNSNYMSDLEDVFPYQPDDE